MKSLEPICQSAIEVIKKTGEFLHDHFGNITSKEIEVKSKNSLVTFVDKTAEEQLVKGLKAILPEAVFLTEEETVEVETGEYRWIIDPLDGTTNFLHQIPLYCISVALEYKDQLVLGIVYAVEQEECFYAWKDGGAFMNEKAIQVTSTPNFGDALIATGFPYYDYSKTPQYLKALEFFMEETRGLRRCGSAAIDLVYVACGRFDAYWEYSINSWDVAAGAFIVQEAGGKVSDFSGGDNYLHGKEIISCNSALFEQLLAVIKREFIS